MYLLKCSVCDGEFNSKESWTRHLVEGSHLLKARQFRARRSLLRRRKSCLVAYASFPLSSPEKALGLLQKISKDLLTFVTDFAWMEGIPQIGLIQFENSTRLAKFLSSLGYPKSCQIEVDDLPVAFKKSIDLMDLEWKSLISVQGITKKMKRENSKSKEDCSKQATQDILHKYGDGDTNSKPEVTSTSMTPPAKKKKVTNVGNKRNVVSKLRQAFDELLEAMKIPDSDFQTAEEIRSDLEEKFRSKGGDFSTTRVGMIRNWFLRLRNSATAIDLPIYLIYREGIPNDPDHCTFFALNTIWLEMANHKVEYEECYQKYTITMFVRKNGNQLQFNCIGYKCLKKRDFQFIIINRGSGIDELQRCRLLCYYCTFDPRISDFIGLIYFWISVNNVSVLAAKATSKCFKSERNVQDPWALEYLLMAYLCKEKFVPSLRQLQAMPHKSLTYTEANNIDMGFSDDPTFAQQWFSSLQLPPQKSDKYVLSILNMASNFFSFCARLGRKSGACVVNTKDGEIFPQKYFKPKNNAANEWVLFGTQLTPEEIACIQKALIPEDGKANPEEQIILMNPFNQSWFCSIKRQHFIQTICPKMYATNVKLTEFIKNFPHSKRIENIDLKRLLLL